MNRIDQYIDENGNLLNIDYRDDTVWYIDKETGEKISRPFNEDELVQKQYYLQQEKEQQRREVALLAVQKLLETFEADVDRLLAIQNDDRLTQSDRDVADVLVRLLSCLPAVVQSQY